MLIDRFSAGFDRRFQLHNHYKSLFVDLLFNRLSFWFGCEVVLYLQDYLVINVSIIALLLWVLSEGFRFCSRS